jgi:hypothetical protein
MLTIPPHQRPRHVGQIDKKLLRRLFSQKNNGTVRHKKHFDNIQQCGGPARCAACVKQLT